MILFYKWDMPVLIYNALPYKFIDKLTNCEFCMENHLACIVAVCWYYQFNDLIILLFGVMAAALSHTLKELKG